jgi:hypothetical protein
MSRNSRKAHSTISGIRGLFGVMIRANRAQTRYNLDQARLRKIDEDRRTVELRNAELSNKLVLQDLKIVQLRYELASKGLLEGEFRPTGYEETHG